MAKKPAPAAVVTGVSSGIGRAVAASLINRGWRVFGSVRKDTDAHAAADALGEAFTPLLFDVTDVDGIEAAAAAVRAALAGRKLGGLVNNAGIAVAGPVAHVPLDEVQFQFDVNIFGPLRVSQAFIPLLGADKSLEGKPGIVVNMSSVAGKMASPFMSPYAMSKHALEAMTEAMRRELMIYGIDAISVGPGAVKTPIWAKADDIDVEQYQDTDFGPLIQGMKDMMQSYGDSGIEPEEVGDLVADILERKKRGTRYAILNNKFVMWTLPRLLPKRWVDGLVAKRFGIQSSSASTQSLSRRAPPPR